MTTTPVLPSLAGLIADLRMNHEYCPKDVILQAADALESIAAAQAVPVADYLCQKATP